MNEYRDEHDLLMDSLLNEAAGGETPPDLTARIMARATNGESVRKITPPRTIKPLWRRPAILAAAAAVLLATGIAIYWSHESYPAPIATGQLTVVGGGPLARGKEVATDLGQAAKLALGGYCHIELADDTRLVLAGNEKDESVYLKHGEVKCQVDHGVGAFNVHTDLGDIKVTGTEFRVKLEDVVTVPGPQIQLPQGENPMTTKNLVVSVITGTVMLSSPWGQTPVASGQTKVIIQGEGAQQLGAPATQPAKPWSPVPGSSFGAFPTTQAAVDYLKQAELLLKKELNASDEQWANMQPKIMKVIQLTSARGINFIPRVGVLNYPSENKPTETTVAVQSLRNVAGKAGSSDAEVAAKVKAVQDAQTKTQAELQKAEDELRAVCTPRQEAQLIMMRLLD